jgi:SOS response regulatory protein OraA/RecX
MPAEKRKQVNVLGNCGGKILPKTLIEQIMDINDIRQLIQILEVAKTKVRRKKLNQRKDRKKWEN